MLVLRVEAAQYTVSEGSGSVEVGVVKEGISEEPTTVMLTTSDGTALGEGRDMHILLEDIVYISLGVIDSETFCTGLSI